MGVGRECSPHPPNIQSHILSLFTIFRRQRYISATCGMALLRDVPQEVMFRVLIERINIVAFLPWLRAAAVANENQLDFVMAGNDRRQWQVVDLLEDIFCF